MPSIYKVTNQQTKQSYIGYTSFTINIVKANWYTPKNRSTHFKKVLEMFDKELFEWEFLEIGVPKEEIANRKNSVLELILQKTSNYKMKNRKCSYFKNMPMAGIEPTPCCQE